MVMVYQLSHLDYVVCVLMHIDTIQGKKQKGSTYLFFATGNFVYFDVSPPIQSHIVSCLGQGTFFPCLLDTVYQHCNSCNKGNMKRQLTDLMSMPNLAS